MTNITQSKPAPVYEIRLRGHVDRHRVTTFEGFDVTHHPDGETILTGDVPDQAALYGILNRLRDLGVPLVSVNQLREARGEK